MSRHKVARLSGEGQDRRRRRRAARRARLVARGQDKPESGNADDAPSASDGAGGAAASAGAGATGGGRSARRNDDSTGEEEEEEEDRGAAQDMKESMEGADADNTAVRRGGGEREGMGGEIEEEEDEVWFLMAATWLKRWHAYVQSGENVRTHYTHLTACYYGRMCTVRACRNLFGYLWKWGRVGLFVCLLSCCTSCLGVYIRLPCCVRNGVSKALLILLQRLLIGY